MTMLYTYYYDCAGQLTRTWVLSERVKYEKPYGWRV